MHDSSLTVTLTISNINVILSSVKEKCKEKGLLIPIEQASSDEKVRPYLCFLVCIFVFL